MDNASEAVAELWLAVTFQALSTIAILGIDHSISATLHAVFRPAVAGADAGDIVRSDHRRAVAERRADVGSDGRNPLVGILAHRDHDFRVGDAVDRPSGRAAAP